MIVRLGGRRQRLDEMPNNAAAIASVAHSENWQIGDRPMVAAACRCESPVWERDEVGADAYQLGTKCVKCGRRRGSRPG